VATGPSLIAGASSATPSPQHRGTFDQGHDAPARVDPEAAWSQRLFMRLGAANAPQTPMN
jgi:hypothetical protein